MAPLRSAGSVDPGWEHGVAQDHSKKKVKCNYCGKVVSGGIYRLKQHLARISGQVTYCNHVPEDVCQKMKENLEGRLCTKRQRQSEDEEQPALKWHPNEDDDDDDDDEKEGSTSHKHKGKRVLLDSNSSPILTPLRSLGYVDPGWAHGVVQDDRKKKLKCNYCGKVVSGGINRFKQHLARIPGEVASCKNVPEEVYVKMKDNMKWHRTGRRSRRPETKETGDLYTNSDNEYEENLEESPENFNSTERLLIGDKSLSRDTGKRFWESTPDNAPVPLQTKRSRQESLNLETAKTSTPQLSKQLIVRTGSHRKVYKETISAISKFFYHTGIPSNIADSPYFCKMLELVGECGQGFLKIPSSQVIAGEVLQDEIATIKECLVEFKASCTVTGCTIVADNWKDAQGTTLINFLVSCPRGVYFVSSVDATDIVEDPTSLFKLLDKVVDEMGEENVVQVITENTGCYKLAGQMLEEKRRNLFWTPCAAHFIDGILEDFLKIKWVEECMDKGKKITKFIYNRESLLNLVKEFTGGRELLRPSATRTATSFVNLQSLLEHRTAIKRIFQSNKWLSCQFSKSEDGKEVEKIVLNSTFWKKMQFINKSVEPILRVLQKVDSDEGLLLATFHNDMFRAKHQIRAIHGDDIRKYTPFWDVIAHHWSSFFHHPLYMAAYFLNPSYRYRHDFSALPEAQRGLNDCITRLEPDNGRRVSVSMQVPDFVSAKADFGTELAVTTRAELDPAAWWQQHGINSLELQRIAIRILSQTCSSFGYEHHWSTYYQTHGKIHNHLAQKKVNDYMYVHYNLHLRERQLRKKINNSISLDNVLFESLLDEWTVETDKQTFGEDEEIDHDEMEQYENGLHQEAQLAAIFEPLKAHQSTVDEDDDDDLDLLDDDFE